MRANFLLSFLRALKLPLKLLVGFFGKKPCRIKTDLERKQLAYVRNFSPSRLKNRTWQPSFGKAKKLTKKKKNFFKKKDQWKPVKNNFAYEKYSTAKN